MSAPPIARLRGGRAPLRGDPANFVLLASLCLVVFACSFLIGRAASPAPRVAGSPSAPATTIASAPLSAGIVRVPGPAGAVLAAAGKHGSRARAATAAAHRNGSRTGPGTGATAIQVLATPVDATSPPPPLRPASPPVQSKSPTRSSASAPTAGFDSSG